ncbi:hypothetical protein [Streptomyces sp. bgisy082]|uniref:hypothetical protein n=1 Tax=Streptomyces sp. bgisy082 TaxID=3413776 RepID=UPI003D713815
MYDLEGAADHLDEAVEVGREAVGGAVAGQPERALHLDNLARALRARGIHNDDAADLDLAASASVQAAQTPAAASAARIRAALDAARILGTDRVEQAADLLATAVSLLAETVPGNCGRETGNTRSRGSRGWPAKPPRSHWPTAGAATRSGPCARFNCWNRAGPC